MSTPDPAEDESDSDLDLDLQELDPGHLSSPPPHSRNNSYSVQDFAKRIPLRNLRAGRLRSRPQDDEDLEDLLPQDRTGHHATNRDSAGSFDSAHDGAALLPGAHPP